MILLKALLSLRYNVGDDQTNFPCPGQNATDTGPCPIELKDRMVLYSNRLLGNITMDRL